MTPQEIIDNNILLAEFMGYKQYYTPLEDCFEVEDGVNILESELKFHNNWNWLMLVVEKIESLDNGFEVLIRSYNVEIKGFYENLLIVEELIDNICNKTKFEATYSACVQFVKWYNQNKGGN